MDLIPKQQPQSTQSEYDVEAELRKFHEKMFTKAREYWLEHGNLDRASMTYEELVEQFMFFDENDIPRLKSDGVDYGEGVKRTLAAIDRANIHSGEPDIVERSREILNTEFAEHLLKEFD